jgi:hypothetical protein
MPRKGPTHPFESIEGAYEYVSLLAEATLEARHDVAQERALARSDGAARREQALQLAAYKLAQLGVHLNSSRRLLNDLRTLRRLLSGEREGATEAANPERSKRG